MHILAHKEFTLRTYLLNKQKQTNERINRTFLLKNNKYHYYHYHYLFNVLKDNYTKILTTMLNTSHPTHLFPYLNNKKNNQNNQ